MKIEGFRLTNYKCFQDTGEVCLMDGFNIVVGANNSGKSTLLEALSTQFASNPNYSITSRRHHADIVKSDSQIVMKFSLSKAEIAELLRGKQQIIVGLKNNNTYTEDKYWKANIKDENLINIKIQNGKVIGAAFNEKSNHPANYEQYQEHAVSVERGLYAAGGAVKATDHNLHDQFEMVIANQVIDRVFSLKTIVPSQIWESPAQDHNYLKSDASNLSAFLSKLQGNTRKMSEYQEQIRYVLPSIHEVSSLPSEGNGGKYNLFISSIDPQADREDLRIPVRDCGLGVAHVLALVALNFVKNQAVVVIDEPQSFLHPGALRRLMDVLPMGKANQYIIATHSPSIVASTRSERILLLSHKENVSSIEQIDSKTIAHQRKCLAAVGARMSDLFGIDSVLWVEGETEEICFPEMLRKHLGVPHGIPVIRSVVNTGDFQSRNKKNVDLVIRIYQQLSSAGSLAPEVAGFIFDREDMTEQDQRDAIKRSSHKVTFLPRRMFENYLLNADAIASAIRDAKGCECSESEIQQHITKSEAEYQDKHSGGNWMNEVDGSKLLSKIFREYSIEFTKTRDSVAIFRWMIDNNRINDFMEIIDLINSLLEKSQEDE